MTSFEIESVPFSAAAIEAWSSTGGKRTNWPVVYTLDGRSDVYIGETLSGGSRFRQHLNGSKADKLSRAHVILGEHFNKSVTLDLESFLISMFAGEGKFRVLNGNAGVRNADYFDRAAHSQSFQLVFDELRERGLFERSIPDITNGALFKYSPFKALNMDQAAVVADILDTLFQANQNGTGSTTVVQGEPGTGKTIVAVYLLKLLSDLANPDVVMDSSGESIFGEYSEQQYRESVQNFRLGIVVPQQSLRTSLRKVFDKTLGLNKGMVLSPFDVGASSTRFDLLVVDEAHRLNIRANQPSAAQNKKFADINQRLFDEDDPARNQLDWICAQSEHQVLLLDRAQAVRPADLSAAVLEDLLDKTSKQRQVYRLRTQMRVKADQDYVGYVRRVLDGTQRRVERFEGYDLRVFDDAAEMHEEIRRRDAEIGLARLVAGYAWPWRSKNDASQTDLDVTPEGLRWNSTPIDWVNSPKALDEVGSIHTVQGYDLNYAGVIIGRDLQFDQESGKIIFDRSSYFDTKGKENNPRLGRTYTDEDILAYVRNIYGVLLTRGIEGTYVYVQDPALREHLRTYLSNTGTA